MSSFERGLGQGAGPAMAAKLWRWRTSSRTQRESYRFLGREVPGMRVQSVRVSLRLSSSRPDDEGLQHQWEDELEEDPDGIEEDGPFVCDMPQRSTRWAAPVPLELRGGLVWPRRLFRVILR